MSCAKTLAVLAIAVLTAIAHVPAAGAAPAPAWQLSFIALPTHLSPGTTGSNVRAPIYLLVATNVGAGDAAGPVSLRATFPTGVTPIFDSKSPQSLDSDTSVPDPTCDKTPGQTVTCTAAGPVHPSRFLAAKIPVAVSPSLIPGEVLAGAAASVESPGTTAIAAAAPTAIDTEPPPFGFLPGPAGLSTLFTEEDGAPALSAGSHPDQLTIELGFPVEQPSGSAITTNAGHPRDILTELPPGFVVNPNATAKRCTEVELVSFDCPDESNIGVATVTTETIGPNPQASSFYNMVSPPGAAATVAFDAANVGIFVHLVGGVRSEGDHYGIYAESNDTLARGTSPIEHVQVQLWGDPSGESRDQVRGACLGSPEVFAPCQVEPRDSPLLSMPTACTGRLTIKARARSWEESEHGITEIGHERSADATTIDGTPTEVAGCNQLQFEPTLIARPTTNLADAPSGLEAVLQIPQTDSLQTRATAHLRKAVVALPEGLLLNPASANGLDSCDPDEIGIDPDTGHPNNEPVSCPDASRIGEVEVDTPLLDHPLPGSVFVATPHENPFDSLLAIYVVIDDKSTNTLVKLAGHVVPDPDTGRLITSFDESPQLPFSEFKLDFKRGAHGVLRTPATCGTYQTTSQMTPWSAPDSGPPATTEDSWAITQGPGGGSCATSSGAQPHSPAFEAGTLSPTAGAYSPLVLSLKREDGSQSFAALDVRTPPGLLGKLAGTTSCPDSALALAATKSGNQEKQSPSCPPSSELGNVVVGAGAGPSPYHATGKAYLAGSYKGAPLSLAVITPAVAGPYDLGTVVVKTALHIDPRTTQLSAVSDPLPQILQGVVLDVRSIHIAIDRPDFTLNPTSCDPMAVSGALLSGVGQTASLQSRFQVGECGRLGFKPKLFLRLKGGARRGDNPRLIANLKARAGDANIAAAQVTLPRSAFLDQAHIRTICTRVQWAKDACPRGSIYGRATAKSPLLDYPVQGNVYLRSSANPLPDLVADLRGPAYQPLRVELVGRADSVKGALRNTFDFVPDAPVSSFRLELFGGKHGLVVNSKNLCAATFKATVKLDGQNGKVYDTTPVVKTDCKRQRKRKAARKVAKK